MVLPDELPVVRLRPAKVEREPSPPPDYEVLDSAPVTGKSNGTITTTSSKRSAPEDAEAEGSEESRKKRRVADQPAVVDDDDDDFFEIVTK